MTIRHVFVDPITDRDCVLVIPPGGDLFATGAEPKIGVSHPDCAQLADISIDLHNFYCQACGWNGRVSGGWVIDAIEQSIDDGEYDASERRNMR